MSDYNFFDKFNKMHIYDEHIECLSNHLSNFFEKDEITVFHEIGSLDFHLDVYFIKPTNRAYNILLTSGMSLFQMAVAQQIEDSHSYLFAELMVLLPKGLDFEQIHTGEEKNSWIISMLKQTARFPHHYDTYLGIGHTLQATEDMESYSRETSFIGCVILPSVTFDTNFTELRCGDNKINIYGLFPLYKSELHYKIKNGYDAFVDLLMKADLKEIIDNNRKNLIQHRGLWNIFSRK